MRRWLPLLLTLVLAPSAGASGEAGGVLFSVARPGHGAIALIRPDGSGFTDLTSNESAYETDTREYSWSPSGTRIAFASHRDGPASTEIYVMNADGSGQRRLTFDSGHDSIFDVHPAWSPDGATIAYVQDRNGQDSIRLMSPDGADQRQLINIGAPVRHLLWSPDSTHLLYDVDGPGPSSVSIAGVQTRDWRPLTPFGQTINDFDPMWSPDGRLVALTSNTPPGANHIVIVDAETGTRRALLPEAAGGASWSPDGTQLAFAGVRTFPEDAGRYGVPQRLDLYVVRADGSGLTRLTGRLDEGAFGRAPGASEPTWWPDGSRLFFQSGEGVGAAATTYVVNRDGSCEHRFGPPGETLLYPAWKPGSATLPAPARCVDLRLSSEGVRDVTGLRQRAPLELTVENDGNLTATGVRLEIAFSPHAEVGLDARFTCTRAPALVCTLPDLPAQSSTIFDLALSSSRAGRAAETFVVSADQPEDDTSLNTLVVGQTVLPCVTVGTNGADDLRGSNGNDSICGRGGADRLEGLGGSDALDAGAGDDTVVGGPGRDTLVAGAGRDVVLARDGSRDSVRCGTGSDLVVADRLDRVSADCERVLRG